MIITLYDYYYYRTSVFDSALTILYVANALATPSNWSKVSTYGSNLCAYLVWLASSNSSLSCLSEIAAAIYLSCTLVSLLSFVCRHVTFSPHLAMLIRIVGSDRAFNTLKPVRLYNVTVYSHQIWRPLLFRKLPQQSRCRQSLSRYRRLCTGMSSFRRTQPC